MSISVACDLKTNITDELIIELLHAALVLKAMDRIEQYHRFLWEREIDIHTTSSAFVSFDVVGIVIADTVGVATHQVVPDLLPVRLSAAAADGVLPFQQLLPRGHELRSRVTRTGSYCIAQPLRYVDRYYRCPQIRSMEVGR